MFTKLEVPVKGMDCSGCVRSVKQAIEKIPGVTSAEVLLSSEKAIVEGRGGQPLFEQIKKAVEEIGYHVPEQMKDAAGESTMTEDLAGRIFRLFGVVFGAVLFVAVVGEWLGLFESATRLIPFWAGTLIVLAMGYPVFKKVVVAAFKGQVISHALMALGAAAALLAGEWVTAAIVVFFMRTGDYVEHFTTEKARGSIRCLTDFAPQRATVLRNGKEIEVPVNEIHISEQVVVRPGGKIPVDGVVREGQAVVDQSAITGESMPVEIQPGSEVYAATFAKGGRLIIEARAVGPDTTFGRIISMVEEAEARKGVVQQFADRFSAYYLPVVAGIAGLTYLLSGNVMSTVAVMVVACSCAFALATPVALLASIGSSAKRGLLIKGGKYIEQLAKADVLLIDKTGTLTFGRPELTDVIPLNGITKGELLRMAAGAERYSEHPLSEAVTEAARQRFLSIPEVGNFEAMPGEGVKAQINGYTVTVSKPAAEHLKVFHEEIEPLRREGKTLMMVSIDGNPAGILAAKDAERQEVSPALEQIRRLGFNHIELLTGDHPETARLLARKLGIDFQAGLLPEDKIEVVRKYQNQGHTVVMAGDGMNDAPALAQADVAIAMGVRGTDVAKETSHITLMRDDWMLVPQLIRTAHKTMKVIKWNFGFTTAYNIAGLSLAAFGILPPILAAAAQSIPDVGIMLNSSRLLRP